MRKIVPVLLMGLLLAAPQLFAQQQIYPLQTYSPPASLEQQAYNQPAYAQPIPVESGLRRLPDRSSVQTLATRPELQGLQVPSAGLLADPALSEAQQVSYTFADAVADPTLSPWTKGDFKIVPYGAFWLIGAYNSSRVNPGSYSIFVFSDDVQGEAETVFDARSSRLGLDVTGPEVCFLGRYAKTGGKVEFDFQNSATQTNKGTVLFRHAYAEVKNDYFRFLAGQTWDVVSPLLPPTIMYSVGWGAGNMGYRRAQLRLERFIHLSDVSLITLQGSINDAGIGDFGTDTYATSGASDWPSIQGRIAWTLGHRGKGCRPITLGVSAHVGEQVFDFDDDRDGTIDRDDVYVDTWSFNVDLNAPITDRLTFSGEFFTGENLGTLLGGVVQGVDKTRGAGIYSQGGWIGLHYKWNARWHSGFGYGVDDPTDGDLSAASQRRYNDWYFGNLVCQVTDKFSIGGEISQWQTLYRGLAPGESTRFELMVKYGF